jgi:hypothetical protein
MPFMVPLAYRVYPDDIKTMKERKTAKNVCQVHFVPALTKMQRSAKIALPVITKTPFLVPLVYRVSPDDIKMNQEQSCAKNVVLISIFHNQTLVAVSIATLANQRMDRRVQVSVQVV